MAEHIVVTRVTAVHVECGRCGDQKRIQHDHPDGFTRHVLQPLGSWWVAHRAPRLVLIEVTANGVPQHWKAAS